MMRIDSNTLGRYGYAFLKQRDIIPNKEKTELSFKEIDNIKNTLVDLIKKNLEEVDNTKTPTDKNIFSLVFYTSILAYVNNTDLNKFITLSTDGNVKED
jgi:hypothetical protein